MYKGTKVELCLKLTFHLNISVPKLVIDFDEYNLFNLKHIPWEISQPGHML